MWTEHVYSPALHLGQHPLDHRQRVDTLLTDLAGTAGDVAGAKAASELLHFLRGSALDVLLYALLPAAPVLWQHLLEWAVLAADSRKSMLS